MTVQGYIIRAHVAQHPDGSYRLRPRSSEGLETISIALRHRLKKEHFLQRAFDTAQDDILIVSIMSIRAIHSIEELLRSKNQFKKKIRVLTWQPQNSQCIEGFRLHISDGVYDNDPEKPITQVINAAGRWDKLKEQYPDAIEVRYYSSFPTLQGFVIDGNSDSGWLLVEILTYATPPDDRPALVIAKKDHGDVFFVFQQSCEKLWKDSKAQLITGVCDY